MHRSIIRIPPVALTLLLLNACVSNPAALPVSQPKAVPPNRQEIPPVPPVAPNPLAYAYVVISVSDMEQALGLWQARFGMQVVARREGTDPGLAKIWGVPAGDIIDQALLVTPGMQQGGVHLVRFRLPGPAVREGAASIDSVPKSVDIVVSQIAQRYDEMRAAGFEFRSPVGKLETDGVVVYEVHMKGPDALNLVLLEQPDKPGTVSAQGFGVAPQIILTTPDNLREKAFLQTLLGLEETSYHRFAGPAIEKTVGLPKGAGLDIRILGSKTYEYGRLELVQYEGVKPVDLYPRTKPPARGMLSVTYFVTDFDAMRTRGASLGLVDHGRVATVFGETRMASVVSPSGLRIDLVER